MGRGVDLLLLGLMTAATGCLNGVGEDVKGGVVDEEGMVLNAIEVRPGCVVPVSLRAELC